MVSMDSSCQNELIDAHERRFVHVPTALAFVVFLLMIALTLGFAFFGILNFVGLI